MLGERSIRAEEAEELALELVEAEVAAPLVHAAELACVKLGQTPFGMGVDKNSQSQKTP
jgi:hypothetical protein